MDRVHVFSRAMTWVCGSSLLYRVSKSPLTVSILVRYGLGACKDACRYHRFSRAYAPRRSISPAKRSRNSPIAAVAFLACLLYYSIRDWCTSLMRPLYTLRLWRGLWRRDAHLLISRMDLGDIQRGRGGRFRVGGTGSRVLRVWNLESTLMSSTAGGGI